MSTISDKQFFSVLGLLVIAIYFAREVIFERFKAAGQGAMDTLPKVAKNEDESVNWGQTMLGGFPTSWDEFLTGNSDGKEWFG